MKRAEAAVKRSQERVALRPPRDADADEFIRLNLTSRRLHRGLVTPPLNQALFGAYMERTRLSNARCFFVCVDEQIAGAINLSQIVFGGFRSAYLGYFIGAPFAGRGLMTEALGLMLRYTFQTLKLHRIEANIQPRNMASIKLVKRAGFSLEGYSPRYLKIDGRWRDHERWALLVEDWRARRKEKD